MAKITIGTEAYGIIPFSIECFSNGQVNVDYYFVLPSDIDEDLTVLDNTDALNAFIEVNPDLIKHSSEYDDKTVKSILNASGLLR